MPDDIASQEFPSLPSDFKDAVALAQRQLKDLVAAIDSRILALGLEEERRRNIARGLKIASFLCGTVIAMGFTTGVTSQLLGGAIPAIVAIERIFANFARLLSVSAAKSAYERIRRTVVARHKKDILSVVMYRDREPERAATTLLGLIGELRDALETKRNELETQLAKDAYDVLGRLNLEEDGKKEA